MIIGRRKVVAVIGYGYSDWAAYGADFLMDNEEVARHGDKLWKDKAEELFPFLVKAGYKYRP